jgi:hypothetical protein
MKILFSVLFLTIFTACPALCMTTWETYLSNPTPELASKVSKVEYSKDSETGKQGYYAPDLEILRNQVLAGDSEAFRLVYRLLEKTDGGLLEDLTVIISHTIRARPDFFLKELSIQQPNTNVLKSILLMPGLEYTDRIEAQQYELKMRAKALEQVKTISLKSFRDKCVRIIRNN